MRGQRALEVEVDEESEEDKENRPGPMPPLPPPAPLEHTTTTKHAERDTGQDSFDEEYNSAVADERASLQQKRPLQGNKVLSIDNFLSPQLPPAVNKMGKAKKGGIIEVPQGQGQTPKKVATWLTPEPVTGKGNKAQRVAEVTYKPPPV